MVPICIVDDKNLGEGNIVIRNEHLKSWEISFDELWENVFEYAQKNAHVVVNDSFELVRLMGEELSFSDAPSGMLVVTNKQKQNGASAIFYPTILEKMAKKLGGDLVILPSSIHETIVFKAPKAKTEIQGLVSMVREVNNSVVYDEEILSESVYLYDHETKELTQFGE